MAATINLYPPVVDTFMPAFVISDEAEQRQKCKIYFSLSLFNTEDQIANCQVTVRNQNTNLSVLDPGKYPSEVMITNLQLDPNKRTDDRYYIELRPEDIVGGNFIVDQYYKVQIRFTGTDAASLPSGIGIPPTQYNASTGKYTDAQSINNWLVDNLLYFSEWSTVCLIRGISQPRLELKDFSSGFPTTIYNTIANIQVLGKLMFADEHETETLRSYKVTLYDSNENKLLESKDIYTSNFSDPNEINYDVNYSLETGYSYYFTVSFVTQNLYTDMVYFYVNVQQAEAKELNTLVKAWTDEENGRIALRVNRSRAYGSYTGQILIRRTDSKSNFTVWEDVHCQAYDAAPYISIIWYDYTIESGIWYKYGVQGIEPSGARTPMVIFKNPVVLLFDHMFLTGEDKQLKIKFNPQISSYKIVVSENKTDAIGSKYPYIRRNGDVYYSSFPIGGIIASAMDEEGIFTSREEVYGDNKDYYSEYNEENNVYDYNDFIYEKFFRDKVKEFLYDGQAKLFRSPSEGNVLVRLMDINLTPNQTLGRRIWSFTANAYEIDECSMDNYDKYHIYTRISPTIGVTSGDTTLVPIKSIVFINNRDEFPDVGGQYVIYIFEEQLYVWDVDNNTYKPISVPEWLLTNSGNRSVHTNSIANVNNELFTDGEELYQWNTDTESFNIISEPYYNKEFYPDEDRDLD